MNHSLPCLFYQTQNKTTLTCLLVACTAAFHSQLMIYQSQWNK